MPALKKFYASKECQHLTEGLGFLGVIFIMAVGLFSTIEEEFGKLGNPLNLDEIMAFVISGAIISFLLFFIAGGLHHFHTGSDAKLKDERDKFFELKTFRILFFINWFIIVCTYSVLVSPLLEQSIINDFSASGIRHFIARLLVIYILINNLARNCILIIFYRLK